MCTRQLKAFVNPDGGRPIFGWEGIKNGLKPIKLPCGDCPECQKDYYTQWATRGSRELTRWPSSVFITLTYDERNLPANNSLDKDTIQRFIKRVKKHFASTRDNPIRQIYCGEYGTKTKRPHYHAILFNCDFADKKPKYTTDNGHQVYESKSLSALWGLGIAEFGYAQPASIAYLFKYILKKVKRKLQKQPLVIERDGITYEVAHEFIEASRNPGIGAHLRDSPSIKKGYLSVNGVRTKLPKYYSEALKKSDPEAYARVSEIKNDFALHKEFETERRLAQKENAQKKLTDTKKKL